jgi:hypothetical protein
MSSFFLGEAVYRLFKLSPIIDIDVRIGDKPIASKYTS